jgi:hypothetical protein
MNLLTYLVFLLGLYGIVQALYYKRPWKVWASAIVYGNPNTFPSVFKHLLTLYALSEPGQPPIGGKEWYSLIIIRCADHGLENKSNALRSTTILPHSSPYFPVSVGISCDHFSSNVLLS